MGSGKRAVEVTVWGRILTLWQCSASMCYRGQARPRSIIRPGILSSSAFLVRVWRGGDVCRGQTRADKGWVCMLQALQVSLSMRASGQARRHHILPILGRRQAGRVSPCPWHGQPGPRCPVLTHSLFGQNAGLGAKSWELDKGKGSNKIGSEGQLLGTVWVPGLCLQLLPALALRLVSWVRLPSEEVGDPLPALWVDCAHQFWVYETITGQWGQ